MNRIVLNSEVYRIPRETYARSVPARKIRVWPLFVGDRAFQPSPQGTRCDVNSSGAGCGEGVVHTHSQCLLRQRGDLYFEGKA